MLDVKIKVELGAYCSVKLEALPNEVLSKVKSAFKITNPAHAKIKAMGYPGFNEPKFYTLWHESEGKLHIWRGGGRRFKAILREYGIKVEWVDRRLKFDPVGLKFNELIPHPQQIEAAKAMIKYQQGVYIAPTGEGKTEIGLTAIIMVDQPALVVVWNKDLLAQWIERIVKYKILPEKEIGIIQGAKNKFGLITIAMIQSLYKRVDEWKDRFGVVYMDECQRTPARTFVDGLTPFPAKYKWGATADVERRDGKHFLAYECFGYQEWHEKFKIPRYKPIHIVKGLNQTLDPIIKLIATDYEDETYERERNFGELVNRMVLDKERNDLIAYHLKLVLRAGRQVLLFTERVDSALNWVGIVSSWGFMAGPLIGGFDKAEETKATLGLLRSERCRFAATTTYADVGLDVPSLDTAFLTCPSAGNIKRLNQQVGRIVRSHPKKGEPTAYYFWDKHVEGISKHKKIISRRWEKVITVER